MKMSAKIKHQLRHFHRTGEIRPALGIYLRKDKELFYKLFPALKPPATKHSIDGGTTWVWNRERGR